MAQLKIVSGESPREIAARVLSRRGEGVFVEDLLDRTLAESRMSNLDRNLCQELVYGVVRWQRTLDWLIARKTEGRTQKRPLQELLRLGLYQIFWLERIPDHAAVHETVEIARRTGFGPQSGFVNAVLRAYLREADSTRTALNDLKASNPALGYSHPEWLTTRWQKRWGAENAAKLLDWNNRPAKTYARVNTLKTEPGKLLERWREEDVEYDFVANQWVPEGLCFLMKKHPPLHRLQSFQQGWFYIQDPSTLLAPSDLDPRPGEKVLDLCAAPGGKVTYIAQKMGNEGTVVANDIDAERVRVIQENCSRLGVKCVQTLCSSPGFNGLAPRSFDKVLVDAPCSNTGVLRRRLELRWRITPHELSRLQKAQQELLNHAASLTRYGGTVVYSTCSLEPEENQEVLKAFLSLNSGFKMEKENELIPFKDQVDGAYVAVVRSM